MRDVEARRRVRTHENGHIVRAHIAPRNALRRSIAAREFPQQRGKGPWLKSPPRDLAKTRSIASFISSILGLLPHGIPARKARHRPLLIGPHSPLGASEPWGRRLTITARAMRASRTLCNAIPDAPQPHRKSFGRVPPAAIRGGKFRARWLWHGQSACYVDERRTTSASDLSGSAARSSDFAHKHETVRELFAPIHTHLSGCGH